MRKKKDETTVLVKTLCIQPKPKRNQSTHKKRNNAKK